MFDASRQSRPRFPQRKVNNPSNTGRSVVFRLCLFTGLFVIAAIVWLSGLTWWTALLAVLLIACPVVIGWGLFEGFRK